MFPTAVLLFAVTVVLGIALATRRLQDRPLPAPGIIMHGLFALGGLALLMYTLAMAPKPQIGFIAFILFCIAASIGVILLVLHLRSKRIPVIPMVAHGFIGLIAFLIMLVWILVVT